MRVFIDTNVLIDFMAVRQPYYHPAAVLFALAEMGELQLVTLPQQLPIRSIYCARHTVANNLLKRSKIKKEWPK